MEIGLDFILFSHYIKKKKKKEKKKKRKKKIEKNKTPT